MNADIFWTVVRETAYHCRRKSRWQQRQDAVSYNSKLEEVEILKPYILKKIGPASISVQSVSGYSKAGVVCVR